jgi:hypothetical protein
MRRIDISGWKADNGERKRRCEEEDDGALCVWRRMTPKQTVLRVIENNFESKPFSDCLSSGG